MQKGVKSDAWLAMVTGLTAQVGLRIRVAESARKVELHHAARADSTHDRAQLRGIYNVAGAMTALEEIPQPDDPMNMEFDLPAPHLSHVMPPMQMSLNDATAELQAAHVETEAEEATTTHARAQEFRTIDDADEPKIFVEDAQRPPGGHPFLA